ncbi:MAG: hypothetical protein H0U76_15150 [Ktedonobacteraceae bacterium]|nr:hypothetical protein [Ktedonobacteraceae bacterium]
MTPGLAEAACAKPGFPTAHLELRAPNLTAQIGSGGTPCGIVSASLGAAARPKLVDEANWIAAEQCTSTCDTTTTACS